MRPDGPNNKGGVSLRDLAAGALVTVMGLVAGLLASMVIMSPRVEVGVTTSKVVKKVMPPRPWEMAALEVERAISERLPSQEITEAAPPGVQGGVQDSEEGKPKEGGPVAPQEPNEGQRLKKSSSRAPKGVDVAKEEKSYQQKEKKEASSPIRLFTVHLESFKSLQAAQKRAEDLKATGVEAFVQQAQIPNKGTFYRVFVGKFQDKGSATAFLHELQERGAIGKGMVLEIRP